MTLEHYSEDPAQPVYFYGGPFSNFVGGPFTIESTQPWAEEPFVYKYATVEHFFQASKAQDRDAHKLIAEPDGPWVAKRRGRACPLRPDWVAVRYQCMVHGLRAKFAPGSEFAEILLATGRRQIAEDSPTDSIWGIRDHHGGFTGKNLLGRALMQRRAELVASTYLTGPPSLVTPPVHADG